MATKPSVHKRTVSQGSVSSRPKLHIGIKQIAIAIIAALLAIFLVDLIANWGKAYPGVYVGDLDVSGLTQEQIEQKVEERYSTPFSSASTVVYASEEAANTVLSAEQQQENRAQAEQLALEEAQQNEQAWPITTSDLEAYIPTASLAEKALQVGREDGGLGGRISALISHVIIEVKGIYNDQLLENFAQTIDAAIGSERIDWSVEIDDGYASVVEGSDGSLVNRSTLLEELNSAFFNQNDSSTIVAVAEPAPSRTTQEQAKDAQQMLNQVLTGTNTFNYESNAWELTPEDLGDWISIEVAEDESGWGISASLDDNVARASLIQNLIVLSDDNSMTVSFDNSNIDDIRVNISGASVIPDSSSTLQSFNDQLFGSQSRASGAVGDITIDVSTTNVSESMSFEDALNLGLIGEIASYTTEFSTIEGTENRNYNIALVSELLNNSICRAGDTWSYNDTTGNCDESKGFKGAGAIIDGEYSDSVGGGICQVATTVFNAIYVSGFPVIERHNHSLYISSYPQGRDAAVSYGELDLRWKNDSASDVLVRVSCGEDSVTATLYGIDPGYKVSSNVGDWQAGSEYSTVYKTDDSLSSGASYVKTRGTNGRSITVVRTVKDKSGEILHEDTFESNYSPVNQVIVQGPNTSTERDLN